MRKSGRKAVKTQTNSVLKPRPWVELQTWSSDHGVGFVFLAQCLKRVPTQLEPVGLGKLASAVQITKYDTRVHVTAGSRCHILRVETMLNTQNMTTGSWARAANVILGKAVPARPVYFVYVLRSWMPFV